MAAIAVALAAGKCALTPAQLFLGSLCNAWIGDHHVIAGVGEHRSDDACIVRAIVSLAHCLKLKVVAEGVETGEQLRILKSLGCDQYQGYHFSPPITAEAFEDLLRRQHKNSEAPVLSELERTHSKLSIYRAR
jgi:hypothetical protein